ncbi:hypothetical protein P7C71_g2789, partial [Lecanoromycetidae sp. Uapishka_2]
MMATPKSDVARLPSRNPLPLSSAQEGQVRELYYARVKRKCANEIRAHASQQEQDAAREEWFATMDLRRKEREEKEQKKKEQEKFYREWWDLDKKQKEESGEGKGT